MQRCLDRPTPMLKALLALTALLLVGCPHQVDTSVQELGPVESGELTDESLAARIDRVLDFTQHQRTLSLDEHAAWQILHGALAFERDFQVQQGERSVSAVEHLLNGGEMKGWTVELIPHEDGSTGLRAMLEEGSKTGQGHADQWLAVLSQCELPPTQSIRVDDQQVSMMDFVRQVQRDVPRNVKREFSWTLIGLTGYLPTDARWTANDGREWGIEELVEIETEQELASSACGGTHRVIGLAMTLQRHRQAGRPMTETWQAADAVIANAIAEAKRHQNPDGSFSIHYFAGPGSSPDLAQNLGATGHIVEFLAIALDDHQLREPWVRNAVEYLCDVFEKTREVPLECGALYHAAHGLVLYRERLRQE